MARATSTPGSLPRLVALVLALLGCAIAGVPMYFGLADPLPLILIGSGIAVVALAGFLFVSI